MRDNSLNLPTHLRRQRIMSASQVAVVMAGSYEYAHFYEIEKSRDPELYNTAQAYMAMIFHAVEEEGLPCIRRWTDYNGKLTGADFYANDIWPWVVNELSEPAAWYGEDNKPTQMDNDSAPIVQWGEFAGKDTALMMIAGLATALEKSGGKYTRNNKLNKSSVISAAIKAIDEHGKGTEITDRALRLLLDDALKHHAPKLEE